MALNYNAPQVGQGGNLSTIDNVSVDGKKSNQMRSFEWLRKSIITARKEQFFHQLADVTTMPKHMGKTIKVYEYIPLLDDRNNNTMGLEISGGSQESGNLYGSSKDIGTIAGRLPNLTENGGRVNRVGFTRIQREGAIKKYGFFTDFTQEALDFDSDDQLMDHLSRELVNGAVQMSEAVLQMDLLDAASVTVYPGEEEDDDDMGVTVDGQGDLTGSSIVTYEKIMRLDQILTDNRTPRDTQIISGSRFIDTKTIPAGRVMYVGAEVVPLLRTLQDSFGNKVFIESHHYAAATTLLVGEIGSIGPFRIVQVPEMLHWAGKPANGVDNPQIGQKVEDGDSDFGYRTTEDGDDAYFNVYPMLVVGSKSFTAIGFQTNGKVLNLTAMTKMPGMATMGHEDPYGSKGLSSLQWYQGTLILRPERIGMIKTLAPI